MERSTLQTRLRVAVRQLLVDEWSLFTSWVGGRPVSERTNCAHLAWYLRPQVPRSWDIDCEYNRAGLDGVKRTADGSHPADLIIHKRGGDGADGHNLLLLELKVTDRAVGQGGSEEVLQEVCRAYKYRYGAFVHLGAETRSGRVSVTPTWRWWEHQTPDKLGQRAPVFPDPKALDAIHDEARAAYIQRYPFAAARAY